MTIVEYVFCKDMRAAKIVTLSIIISKFLRFRNVHQAPFSSCRFAPFPFIFPGRSSLLSPLPSIMPSFLLFPFFC